MLSLTFYDITELVQYQAFLVQIDFKPHVTVTLNVLAVFMETDYDAAHGWK
jgi:hypothetical protein